jgi:hypothetical protein
MVPSVSPLSDYNQPVVYSQIAPEIAKMPPTMITLNVPQNYVLALAVIGLILMGVIVGLLMGGPSKESVKSVKVYDRR